MNTKGKAYSSEVRTARISGELCNLTLQKFCYNDDGTIKAVIIDEGKDKNTGSTFYLCEFPNRERKWIHQSFCWIDEEIVGIAENVTCIRKGK